MVAYMTNIKLRRMLQNLRARDIARQLGVSKGYYSMVECGKRIPSQKLKIKMSRILRASVEELFLGK